MGNRFGGSYHVHPSLCFHSEEGFQNAFGFKNRGTKEITRQSAIQLNNRRDGNPYLHHRRL